MSGTRLTRKVTVEGSKKLPESGGQSSSSGSGTRRSVFDRLGPGTSERARPREPYPPEKCRNWLRDGRCQFGRNCKFLHGPFSEPKQRTKSLRSVVRSDVDRSEERDEGGLGGRTRSLDSLEPEDEEEIPIKRKKSRPVEESGDPGKKSEKLKRRQHVEKQSSEGEGENEDERKKRRKKVKKRHLSVSVVLTKSHSPEQEQKNWGDDDSEEERNETLDWEERGELDFERQLNLEKRRQDLQRQLALMDEEEAAREKAERKIREPKKDREEEAKPVVPVVHSKLHPEKSSVSPGDEFSPVSSQSTPKKKKKKVDGEAKKVKTKRKVSPAEKELKKRKGVKAAAEGVEANTGEERTRKITELSPEPSKSNISREQPEFEVVVEEKSRAVKKKQSKNKPKVNSGEDAYESPSDVAVRRSQRPLSSEEIPRDKRAFSPEEQRQPAEKLRRRIALSSPETADSPTFRYASEERRRVTDLPDGSPRKPLHDVHGNRPPGESDYKAKSKGYDKRYRQEESPGGTPEHGRRTAVKDQRHVEEGRVERRKVIVEEPPPRSPSPEDIPPRGPITPPEEQRRRRTPPREDRRGPRTPPGEPEYDNDVQKHLTSERAPPRRRGPQTPPHPSTPPVRARFDKKREEIYEGRPESVPYREDLPRPKDRADRDTRYSRARGEEVADELSRGGRGHPPTEEDFPRSRGQDEEIGRARHRDDRQEDFHQRGRPRDDRADDFHRTRETEPERSDDHHRNRVDDPRGDEFQRRKPEGDDDYLRRREERDEGHFRGRNRELEKDDERHRRRDERGDEHQRGRGRDEYEDELQRPRGRDIPRRQFEGDDRHWEGRGERDSKEGQFIDRDRRRNDMPRQDMPDNRARERPGERPRDRDGRHPPPGPDYHRRTSPISHGPRRSPPPHGPPRGPHRYMERRRSLSPGGRRDEGYRPGPPRDQGGYGMGREPMRGRGGYSAPFDSRGRPMDDGRRRNSTPPRQYADRGRGAPRGRGVRAGRGFPDRMRPPGDRFQEPRDSRAPWDPERRREREHPRDRGRPHDESRDRERRPRSELSPGRGPRHWEDKRGGSPGRGSSPPRDRRAHEQEKIPREVEEDRRRRSENEEDEWEYEEDIGDDKERIPKQGERKRPRENTSSVSTTESPLAGKRRRSETPETEETAVPEAAEVGDKSGEAQPTTETPTKQTKPETGTPIKAVTKIKKKKAGKKEGKVVKSEGEGSVESHMTQETVPETEAQIESERQAKSEKKHKKDKVKTKEKATKKKKKSSTTSAEETDVVSELPDEPKNAPEEGGAVPSEKIGEAIPPSEGETITKLAKKRRHGDAPEGDETKGKGSDKSDKPPKKKKKKKHQPEVVFQPWADLEGEDEDTSSGKLENSDQVSDKAAPMQKDRENDGEKLTGENTGGKQDSSKVEEQVAVFSDWSDDSPIGDDTWSDINEPAEIADNKPKASEDVPTKVGSPVENSVPAYDDVYDPISDDELDAMLGDEDEEGGVGISGATGHASAPMAVEDVDWSALVTTQGSAEKTGIEPGSHLKRFTPGSLFSRIGISSSLAGPRLTKLVQEACAKAANESPTGAETLESTDVEGVRGSPVSNSVGALMAGAAAKRRERQLLFSDVGPCRRALCARKDLAMRKRLRRLTGKVGVFQTPPSAPVDNELYLMSVALYKHEQTSTDSSNGKLIPSRVGSVLATLTS